MRGNRSKGWVLCSVCLACIALTFDSAFGLPQPADPDAPRYELIDGTRRIGEAHDLLVDALGLPHAVYLDHANVDASAVGQARLIYTRYTGYRWNSVVIGEVEMRQGQLQNQALVMALGVDSVHVLVVETRDIGVGDDRMVLFTRATNGSVVRRVLDTGAGSQPALAVDSAGSVFAAWVHGASGGVLGNGIRMARVLVNGSPVSSELPDAPQLSSPSLTVHSSGEGAVLGYNQCLETPSCRQRAARVLLSGVTQLADINPSNGAGPSQVRLASNVNGSIEALVAVGSPPTQLRHSLLSDSGWVCLPQASCEVALDGLGLSADFVPAAHALAVNGAVGGDVRTTRRAISVRLRDFGGTARARVLRMRNGATSFSPVGGQPVPANLPFGSIAIGSDGQPILLGVSHDHHRDLLSLTINRPWSTQRVPSASARRFNRGLALARDPEGSPLVLGRDASNGAVQLLRWLGPASLDFGVDHASPLFRATLPGNLDPEAASMQVARNGEVHIAVHDRNGDDLVYLRNNLNVGGAWSSQRVLTTGSVGHSPTMLRYPDGSRAIVFVGSLGEISLLHAAPSGTFSQRTLSGDVRPGPSARPRAVVAGIGQLLRVSWFDPLTQRVMLTTLGGNPAEPMNTPTTAIAAPTAVPHTGVHDLDLLASGEALLAYTVAQGNNQLLRTVWRNTDGSFNPGSAIAVAEQIHAVRVAASGGSPARARLLWTERRLGEDRLVAHVDQTTLELGQVQLPTGAAPELALDADHRLTALVGEANEATLLRLRERLDETGPTSGFPPGFTGVTQTLPPRDVAPLCFCLVLALVLIDCSTLPPFFEDRGAATAESSVMLGLQERFASTPAGLYYLRLFATHSREIMTITLADTRRLSERWRTWQDLVPAFRALVENEGDSVRFSAENMSAAREVLQGWAQSGSPALQAAVAQELSRTDNFNAFIGMTALQWFNALAAPAGDDQVFRNGFEN